MDEVGCPEPAALLARTASARGCCPSSRQRSKSSMTPHSPFALGQKLDRCTVSPRGKKDRDSVHPRPTERHTMSESRLHQLSRLGQSVWIDSISRDWLRSGLLDKV